MPLEIRGAHFLIRSAQLVRGTRLEWHWFFSVPWPQSCFWTIRHVNVNNVIDVVQISCRQSEAWSDCLSSAVHRGISLLLRYRLFHCPSVR